MTFILSKSFAQVVVLLLLAAAAFVAGEGRRKLAGAFALTVAAAVAAGVAIGFITLIAALLLIGRGEWSGIAALVFGIYAGAAAAALALLAGIIRILFRWRIYAERQARVWGFHIGGLACLALAALTALPHFPHAQTDSTLAKSVVGGVDALRDNNAENELKQRGTQSVPALINSLRAVPAAQVHEFQSGLNSGVMNALRLLGELGGPEAIAELRAWFQREDAAPDIRATAARALGQAGDTGEAPAIGALLENRTYEWRKSHPDLMLALGMMKAGNEVNHLRSALRVNASDGSFALTLYQDGIRALLQIDTPEARAVIDELETTGDPSLRARAREIATRPR